jgi:hypothetical protein
MAMNWLQSDNGDGTQQLPEWLQALIKGGAAGGQIPQVANTPAPTAAPQNVSPDAASQQNAALPSVNGPTQAAPSAVDQLHTAEQNQNAPVPPPPSLSVPGTSRDVPNWLAQTPTDTPSLAPTEHAQVPGRPRGPFDKIPDGQPGSDSWRNQHNKLREGLALGAAALAEFGGRDPWGTNGRPGEGMAILQPWLQSEAAKREYDTNLPAIQQQADIKMNQANADIAQKQAAAQSKIVFDPTTGRYIPVQMGVANTNAQAKKDVAATQAQNRLDVENLKVMVEKGEVARLVPQQNGGYMAYNKFNQPMGELEGSVVPSMMERVSNTVEFKQDQFGNWNALPKTTVSKKVAANGSQPGVVSGTPAAPAAGSVPLPAGGPTAAPASNQGGNPQASAPRVIKGGGGLQARPVMGANGQPMGGNASNQMVYAYDPKANELVATTRSDAGTRNLQITANNVSAKQIMDDRAMSDRLVDVQTKMNRYKSLMNSADLSEYDQNKMALLLNDDKFKLGAFGAEIPVDELNQYLKQMRIDELSDTGKKALISYYNAREAINGYARVLSGSGQASDKSMELNLNALPSPVMPRDFTTEAINQFGENVGILARRFPRFQGAPTPMDVQKQGQAQEKEQQKKAAPQQQQPQQWLQNQSPFAGWNPT